MRLYNMFFEVEVQYYLKQQNNMFKLLPRWSVVSYQVYRGSYDVPLFILKSVAVFFFFFTPKGRPCWISVWWMCVCLPCSPTFITSCRCGRSCIMASVCLCLQRPWLRSNTYTATSLRYHINLDFAITMPWSARPVFPFLGVPTVLPTTAELFAS